MNDYHTCYENDAKAIKSFVPYPIIWRHIMTYKVYGLQKCPKLLIPLVLLALYDSGCRPENLP